MHIQGVFVGKISLIFIIILSTYTHSIEDAYVSLPCIISLGKRTRYHIMFGKQTEDNTNKEYLLF